MRRITRHFSSPIVTAVVVALVVGGTTAVAAPTAVTSVVKFAKHAKRANYAKKAGRAKRAKYAKTASRAKRATLALSAQVANNSAGLGGHPASDYVRNQKLDFRAKAGTGETTLLDAGGHGAERELRRQRPAARPCRPPGPITQRSSRTATAATFRWTTSRSATARGTWARPRASTATSCTRTRPATWSTSTTWRRARTTRPRGGTARSGSRLAAGRLRGLPAHRVRAGAVAARRARGRVRACPGSRPSRSPSPLATRASRRRRRLRCSNSWRPSASGSASCSRSRPATWRW